MIVTFYSYKGGVGRTQMLANLAAYMCYKHQKKVLAIDWDLEAPGLHEYLGADADEAERGLIDLFVSYEKVVDSKEAVEIDTETLPKLDESYIIPTKIKGNAGGRVDLVTAGSKKDYHMKVNDFNWHRFYHLLDGKVYIEYLKKHLKTLDYDLIFIDSRTGVTDYSGICNIQFPEVNIIALAPNQQNLKGALTMAEKIAHSPYLKLKVDGEPLRYPIILPILSRLDKTDDKQATSWQRTIKKEFGSYISRSMGLLKSEQSITDYIEATLLYYTLDLAYRERILFRQRDFQLKRNAIGIAAQFENIGELILLNANKKGNTTTSEYQPTKENPKALASLGLFHYHIGNYQEALNSLKRAVEIDPTLEDAWFNLGNAYDKLKQYEQAIEAFNKAIQIKPDFHEAWYNLGNTYDDLKQYEQAIEAYKKAIQIKPDKHEAWNNLGSTYDNLEKYQLAIYAYKKVIQIKPDDHDVWNNLGNTYYNLERYQLAINAYKKAIQIKPGKHEAWYNLGSTYGSLKQYKKAIHAFNKAIQIKPDKHNAWNNLGITYKNLNQYKQAIEAYNKVIQIKPDKHDAWSKLGWIYLLKAEIIPAKQAFLQVLKINEKKAHAFMNLGHIYLIQKNRSLAIKHYHQSIQHFPKDHNFFEGFKQDFEDLNLPQYSIKKADYFALMEELKTWAKQEGHL